ncbi:MAG: phosphotransferase [Pseudomonadales bacterium]|nr:phosphotransferase [Pseudomonadales bacterium]
MNILIPDLMKHRAAQLGELGTTWLRDVESVLANVAASWNLNVGPQLSGGTEALVFVTSGDTSTSVLKLGLPNSLDRETEALENAQGVAYAKLLAFDTQRDAILVEQLGAQLAEASLPVEQQIRIICATLKDGWQRIDSLNCLMTGAEKAQAQAAYIVQQWEILDRPCPQRTVDQALAFASEREAAYDPSDSYLIHGDAHIWNTLEAPNSPTGYKFVDPDGLFGERAIDLAISLREWRDELLIGDTLLLGLERCELLAGLAHVDSYAIWQWGFIEHVSSGLLDLNLRDFDAAVKHFSIANCWVEA